MFASLFFVGENCLPVEKVHSSLLSSMSSGIDFASATSWDWEV